jgi:hypothetical protein
MNLIINGPGRSGTTLLSKLLSFHADFGWISGYVNNYPFLPILSCLNFIYRINLFDTNLINKSKFPKPAEAYKFWSYYLKSFSDGYTPSKKEASDLKKTITEILKYQYKDNFITKITGAGRTSVLDEIFDNYSILWIERDPRVIVSSYLKQKWFYKDKIEEFNKLTTEDKIRFYSKYYMRIYSNSKSLNRDIIFYEDLCENPISTIEKVLNAYELKFTKSHQRFISNYPIKQLGWEFYKKFYTDNEINLLNELLKQPLKEYKYF